MCGILGFIGESKYPEITEALITKLFVNTRIRGTDASGYYCVTNFKEKNIFYYKQPISSNLFVNKEEYKNIWNNKINLGIFHCRAASSGVGIPAENVNNHPFISTDFKTALIHNGLIAKEDYENLLGSYEVESKCDSEIVLRLLEQKKDKIDCVRDFLSYSEKSYFAIAAAFVTDSTRSLILGRNIHRPLIIIDLRKTLGQIIFASTIDLFVKTVDELSAEYQSYFMPLMIYELKKDFIYKLDLEKDNNIIFSEYKSKKQNVEKKKPVVFKNIENMESDFKLISSLIPYENLFVKNQAFESSV